MLKPRLSLIILKEDDILMNISNNKRKRESQEKIQKVFIELIQTKEINKITVSDICKKANLNRTTFYSNYIDIYDLADKIKEDLFQKVLKLYPNEVKEKKHSYDFLKLFNHIKENQMFYKTYFKLNHDNDDILEGMIDYSEFEKYYNKQENIHYHIIFFKAGFNAIIKRWIYYGCKESPEEIRNVIINEYKNKNN